MLNSKLSSLPKRVFIVYIALTVFLFLFGPIEYKYIGTKEVFNCCAYILVFIILSSKSYSIGAKSKSYKKKIHIALKGRHIEALDIVKIAIAYSIIMFAILIYDNNKIHGGLSFSNFNYFSAMAETYTYVKYETTLGGWLLSYTAIFKIIAIIGGCYYWDKLNIRYRIGTILVCSLVVTNNIFFVGSQKQIIDLFIYVLIGIVARRISLGKSLNKKIVLLIVISIIIAILVMAYVINARVELWEYRYNAVSPGMPQESTLKTGSIIYNIIPTSILAPIVYLSGYFSQGYRGLALCMNEEFIPSWGMGFSFKVMNDFARWFDIPIETIENSYPVRMSQDYGIGAYSNWHTIFPWFASDITFIGALLIVSLFIYLWGKAWNEWLKTENFWSLVLFIHLTVLVLYIPCNNQLFQTRESIVSTILAIIIWLLFRGKATEE